jgi:NAD(P)-dependent dehydrogenase (short-subunit alcohol dehydrogenase family)
MTDKKTWFITGAGRGMGLDIAGAALAAGNAVVATGRNPDTVAEAVGEADDLLVVKLDVTSAQDAEAAVKAAVDRFGRIDVLVNNAASFYAGFFEELTPEQIERQIAVSLIGPMNVTRAILPGMRKQRSGHLITISSTAGLASGVEFTSAYAASKFGLEGWMEALRVEVAPFGIHTTIVNPGFFRTELLSEQSTRYAEPSIADYDARRAPLLATWKATHGQQAGDPAKLARALLTIASQQRRRAASSRGPMPSAPPSRRSPTCRRTSSPTGSSRYHSLSTRTPELPTPCSKVEENTDEKAATDPRVGRVRSAIPEPARLPRRHRPRRGGAGGRPAVAGRVVAAAQHHQPKQQHDGDAETRLTRSLCHRDGLPEFRRDVWPTARQAGGGPNNPGGL